MAPSSVGGNSDEPVPASADETQSRASYQFFKDCHSHLPTVQRHTTVSQRKCKCSHSGQDQIEKTTN